MKPSFPSKYQTILVNSVSRGSLRNILKSEIEKAAAATRVEVNFEMKRGSLSRPVTTPLIANGRSMTPGPGTYDHETQDNWRFNEFQNHIKTNKKAIRDKPKIEIPKPQSPPEITPVPADFMIIRSVTAP
jgi:hypothetical protein